MKNIIGVFISILCLFLTLSSTIPLDSSRNLNKNMGNNTRNLQGVTKKTVTLPVINTDLLEYYISVKVNSMNQIMYLALDTAVNVFFELFYI